MTSAEFRAALKDLRIKQRWLADKLGVDPNQASRWATGKAPVPRYAAYALELLRERREIAARLGS